MFSEAYAEKLVIELEENLNVNYIGLDEPIKNKKSSGRKIDIADVSDLEKKRRKN